MHISDLLFSWRIVFVGSRNYTMAAAFDLKDAKYIAEIEAADGAKKNCLWRITNFLSFLLFLLYSENLLTASPNTAVYRYRGICVTVYYRRSFVDTAHP